MGSSKACSHTRSPSPRYLNNAYRQLSSFSFRLLLNFIRCFDKGKFQPFYIKKGSFITSCLFWRRSFIGKRCSYFHLSFFVSPVIFLSSPRGHLHVVGMLRFMSVINQPSLPTPFCSVLESVSVFMALSTAFHSINSPNKYPLPHSVFRVLFLPYWSFQLYISSWKSPLALI